MLYDILFQSKINVLDFVGKIVIAVPIRSAWEKDNTWRGNIIHGDEGAWYFDEDYNTFIPQRIVKTEANIVNYYDLKPKPLATKGNIRIHRFLIRYRDDEVYLPSISNLRISIEEFFENGERVWTFKASSGSISNGTYLVGLNLDQ